ncbi:MAG: NosD domain-containing protein, partial [Candidatus Thorarchaeota archaeon]
EINNNNMDYLQIGTSTIDEWSIILDANIVMGKELGVFKDIESETITSSSYSQLFLLNCSNVVIPSVQCPTAISRSNEILIQNVQVEDFVFTPLLISKSNAIDVVGSVAQNISDYVITIRDSVSCDVSNFDFIVSGGITSYTSSDISVTNCSFVEPHLYAISLNTQYGGIIKFNEFIGGDTAIFCESSVDVEFRENTFVDTAILNYYSRNTTISKNTFMDSINPGILLYEVVESSIENNQITNCSTGIHLFGCEELLIRGNNLRNNYDYGIYCFNIRYVDIVGNFIYYNEQGILLDSSSILNMIYLNEFGFSNDVNAIDEGFQNAWDDDVCFGNFWSDYDETGVYEIDGAANSIDNYPNILEDVGIRIPVINCPPDFSYNESTTDNVIQWKANDSDPDSFILYQNGSIFQTGTWDGSDLEFNIDGLSPGYWNFTLVVHDDTDRTAIDTVIVYVNATVWSLDMIILYVSIIGVEVAALVGIIFFFRRRRLKSKLDKTSSLDSEDALTPLLDDAQQET